MTVWCHLPTIFNRRRLLQTASILTLCVALITTLFFGISAQAAPGVNQTISFQGRLLSSAGTPVPDGFYNMQFKIYQDGTGSAANNPGGTLRWTETHVNNNANQAVKVTNGYFALNLGAKTAFGTSVDWNQDTLWLSMNVAGLANSCTTFGTSPCAADGEMTPMKRLTAAPYALNAGRLGGITADGFIQNGTTQQTGGFNLSGVGQANILRGTSGVESAFFDRGDAGLLSIGATNATGISIGSASSNQSITIGGGTGSSNLAIGNTNNGSSLTLNGGSAGVTVTSNGGFTVHTEATGTDTLVIGDDGTTTLTLSDATNFTIADSQNQSVLQVGGSGTISTSSGSSLSVNGSAQFNQGVRIGDGEANGDPALITLDRADGTPSGSGDALLGSMYYDTALGRIQCYEAEGWGACSGRPDTFVSISPEYSNAVTNGDGIGTLDSDFCSDTLNVNDADNGMPVCGTNETYNFYDWTSSETTTQTKNMYVTYQLPSNFKEFVEGSTSLLARTDSAQASVTYEIYQNTATGLVACGSSIEVSTGAQTAWQQGVAVDTNDPAGCAFEAGESVVFKISFNAANNAHAYASTLSFAFKNQ